jgi:hypothetical protein
MKPNWRVDLKWVFGLLCLLSVFVASLLYSVSTLTNEETSTGLFTAAVGGLAASQLDDGEWETIRAAAATQPDETYLIPGIDLKVSGAEIAGLTKDEAVLLVARQIAEISYAEGPEAAEDLLSLEDEDGGEFSIGPLSELTQGAHDGVRPYFIASLVLAVIAGSLVIALSRGPGRVGGISLVVATGTAVFAIVWTAVDSVAGGIDPEEGIFAHELGQAISSPASDLASTFLYTFLAATVLIVGSMLVHFGEAPARKAWRRLQTNGAESTDDDTTRDDDKTAGSGPISVSPRTADS